jgi:hypothetical protein
VTGGKLTTYRSMSEEVANGCSGTQPPARSFANRHAPAPWIGSRPGDGDEGGDPIVPDFTFHDVARRRRRSSRARSRRAGAAHTSRLRHATTASRWRASGRRRSPRAAWNAGDISRELDDYRTEVARLFTIVVGQELRGIVQTCR